jgi:hypothetical protein
MPATISAEAHLFLSNGRSKISLRYLSELLDLGADPFRDPVLEGLEGEESLVYVSRVSATLVVPQRPLRPTVRGIAKGLVRLLLACPKPTIVLGEFELPHFFTRQRQARWQIRLVTQRRRMFRLGREEFFVLARIGPAKANQRKWIGVIGQERKPAAQPKSEVSTCIS